MRERCTSRQAGLVRLLILLAQYLEWDQLPTADLAAGNSLNDQVPNPFFSQIAASGCGLDQPTVIRGQLLRPFPEYCSVTEAPPAAGSSNYNALQATYTHRWHSGLNLNVSYTYSKFMDDVQGSSVWAFSANDLVSCDRSAFCEYAVSIVFGSMVHSLFLPLPSSGHRFA
jgi:hypothetical protein